MRHEVQLPQLGEGLHEARIVRLFKSPGDLIKRDEPLYSVETDKAEMDVESPFDGMLESWSVAENEYLRIGARVAVITADETSAEQPGATTPSALSASPDPNSPAASPQTFPRAVRGVSPRVRAYAQEKGLNAEQLQSLAHEFPKLTLHHIDHFLSGTTPEQPVGGSRIYALAPAQRTLAMRLARSQQQVVPASMQTRISWEPLKLAAEQYGAELQLGFHVTAFLLFAWHVAEAARSHPRFRSTLLDDWKVREHDYLTLGIAVAREEDELVTAVVQVKDRSMDDFFVEAHARIAQAREQGDQTVGQPPQLLLSHIPNHEILNAVPVVVAPAVATVFLGSPYLAPDDSGQMAQYANVTISFDHRLINGTTAARFADSIAAALSKGPTNESTPT